MKQARRPPASRGPSTVLRAGPAAASSPPSDRDFHRPAVLILAVALTIRLVHLWLMRDSPYFDVLLGDANGYDAWAQRIARGEWIGSEVFYQAPLYPYFMGLVYTAVGHSPMAVRIVQAFLGAGSCVFLGLAAHRFFSRGTGLAAGLGLAVYAPAVFFDALIQKSVLDVFFVALSLWLIGRTLDTPGARRDWLALGTAMGGLSLTRENALVFIAVIVAWILRRRLPETRARRWSSLGLFAAGLVLVLAPVALRNAAVGGGFYLTTSQFGPNFFIGNNPRADGTYMSLRVGRGAPEYERVDATELAEHASGRRLTPAEVSSYWITRALDFIVSQPAAWLRLEGRKLLLLWNTSEMLDTESQEIHAETSWILRVLGWFGHFGVLVPLALAGAILSWPARARVGILHAMTAAYAISVLIFYVFARYRLPLVPMLMIFAAYAGTALAGAATDTGGIVEIVRPRARTWAAVAAAVLFANWPVLSTAQMKAISENNLATALHAAGRSTEAMTHFERAIALQPDYAPAYNNMGVAQRAAGQLDRAIDSYRRALAVEGDYPDAHYNLANALLEKQQPVEAAAHFETALASIPDSAGVRNNLGIALMAQGRGADAIAAFRAAVAAEPESARAHRNLGSALADAGRIDEAIAMLTRASTLDPADASAHYDLGVVLLQAGRTEQAIGELRRTVQLTPDAAEAHNNLGIALGSMGRLDEAIGEFEQALRINPDFAQARNNLRMAREARAAGAARR